MPAAHASCITDDETPHHWDDPPSRTDRSSTILRITFCSVAVTLGLIQAWVTRFAMNPDGISYLDMGDGFWRGEWHMLLNGYWSPLYGFLLGLALKILKPTPYWEFPGCSSG